MHTFDNYFGLISLGLNSLDCHCIWKVTKSLQQNVYLKCFTSHHLPRRLNVLFTRFFIMTWKFWRLLMVRRAVLSRSPECKTIIRAVEPSHLDSAHKGNAWKGGHSRLEDRFCRSETFHCDPSKKHVETYGCHFVHKPKPETYFIIIVVQNFYFY